MGSLTTPISVPNITKRKVLDFTIHDEDTVPSIDATVQITGAGGVLYAKYTLSARSDGTAARLVDGTGIYSGRFRYEPSAAIAGAYAALVAAEASSNNLAQKKLALDAAMLTVGMLPASLA
jgi:hypothetical protein